MYWITVSNEKQIRSVRVEDQTDIVILLTGNWEAKVPEHNWGPIFSQ